MLATEVPPCSVDVQGLIYPCKYSFSENLSNAGPCQLGLETQAGASGRCAHPASVVWDTAWPGGRGQCWRGEHELPHEVYVTEMSFKRNKPDRQIYVWQKDVKNKWTDGSEVRSGKAGSDVCPGPTAPVQAGRGPRSLLHRQAGEEGGRTWHLLASRSVRSPGQYLQDALNRKKPGERPLKGGRKHLLGIMASRPPVCVGPGA